MSIVSMGSFYPPPNLALLIGNLLKVSITLHLQCTTSLDSSLCVYFPTVVIPRGKGFVSGVTARAHVSLVGLLVFLIRLWY